MNIGDKLALPWTSIASLGGGGGQGGRGKQSYSALIVASCYGNRILAPVFMGHVARSIHKIEHGLHPVPVRELYCGQE